MLNKPQLSVESYHKLNRARQTAFYSSLFKSQEGGSNELFNMLTPYLFSYIKEDIGYVLAELKEQGLCDAYLTTKKTGTNDDGNANIQLLKKEA